MTPKTDSVAVLRNIRDRIEGCGDLSSAMKKPARLAALDAAIAALGAQGEVAAYRLRTPTGKWQWMDGIPCVGTLRLAEDHGWEIEYAYPHPAPPGSDAVTEEMAADVLHRFNATAPSGDHWPPERCRELRIKAMQQAITNAALAARTGKGEANGR